MLSPIIIEERGATMARRIPLVLLLVFAVLLGSAPSCRAGDTEDLQLILSFVKPGQPFTKPAFLKISRTVGKDVMYEGRLSDIEIFAWVQDGITDSLFLTVRGRQCPAWGQVVAKAFAPSDTRVGNVRGQMLRFTSAELEYYLVLVDRYEGKNLLTDLTVFRRGDGHDFNERYHEFADIWADIFSTPAGEFKWPDPSVNFYTDQ